MIYNDLSKRTTYEKYLQIQQSNQYTVENK